MIEYRERKGINPIILSEKEEQVEKYRNELFSGVLKDSINRISANIETNSIDQLLSTKAQIKEEILSFPDCDEKDQYADWLDEISERICNALISNCKKEELKCSLCQGQI